MVNNIFETLAAALTPTDFPPLAQFRTSAGWLCAVPRLTFTGLLCHSRKRCRGPRLFNLPPTGPGPPRPPCGRRPPLVGDEFDLVDML